jgi:hypothetical protein
LLKLSEKNGNPRTEMLVSVNIKNYFFAEVEKQRFSTFFD